MFEASNVFIDTPASRTVTLAVRKAFKTYNISFAQSGGVVIAFSGGPDSTALALACKRIGIPFLLAHLDHALRPESAAESHHVRYVAERLGVKAVIRRSDVAAFATEHRMGTEEAGRAVRFAFLEEVRARYGCSWILLGHHADDLAEDVIMRLIRGAGWPAVAGMTACDDARHIVRPLLAVSKTDIETYIKDCGATCLHDPTNNLDDVLRNRLRHHVIPLLRAENPAFSASVGRLWRQARDDESFWDEYLAPICAMIHQNGDAMTIAEKCIRALPRAARIRFLVRFIKSADPNGHILADTIYAVDAALNTSRRPKQFFFPGGIALTLAQGILSVSNTKS